MSKPMKNSGKKVSSSTTMMIQPSVAISLRS